MPDPDVPQRRTEDQPPTSTQKMKDRTLATACLAFSIAFIYQLSEILKRHSEWSEFRVPAGVGEILFALVCGLMALATALGMDLDSLIKGFTKRT